MDIKNINHFIVLSETLHFSRAAELVNLSQPALSRQIKSLEEELGSSLFLRSRSKVVLTPFGKVFLKKIKPAFKKLEEEYLKLQTSTYSMTGRFTIATYNEFGQFVLSPIITKLRAKFPNIQFCLKLSTGKNIIQDLQKGELDLGISKFQNNISSLASYFLCDENLILTTGSKSSIKNFNNSEMNFITYSNNDPFFYKFKAKYLNKKSKYKIVYTVNSHQIMIDNTVNTKNYSLLPRLIADPFIAKKKLFAVPNISLSSRLHMVLPDQYLGDNRSKLIRQFIFDQFK